MNLLFCLTSVFSRRVARSGLEAFKESRVQGLGLSKSRTFRAWGFQSVASSGLGAPPSTGHATPGRKAPGSASFDKIASSTRPSFSSRPSRPTDALLFSTLSTHRRPSLLDPLDPPTPLSSRPSRYSRSHTLSLRLRTLSRPRAPRGFTPRGPLPCTTHRLKYSTLLLFSNLSTLLLFSTLST